MKQRIDFQCKYNDENLQLKTHMLVECYLLFCQLMLTNEKLNVKLELPHVEFRG